MASIPVGVWLKPYLLVKTPSTSERFFRWTVQKRHFGQYLFEVIPPLAPNSQFGVVAERAVTRSADTGGKHRRRDDGAADLGPDR